jgi:hypothetical protein
MTSVGVSRGIRPNYSSGLGEGRPGRSCWGPHPLAPVDSAPGKSIRDSRRPGWGATSELIGTLGKGASVRSMGPRTPCGSLWTPNAKRGRALSLPTRPHGRLGRWGPPRPKSLQASWGRSQGRVALGGTPTLSPPSAATPGPGGQEGPSYGEEGPPTPGTLCTPTLGAPFLMEPHL